MGVLVFVLSVLAVPILGIADLTISVALGAQGQPPNQLFGWAMTITAVALTIVTIVFGAMLLGQETSVQTLEKAVFTFMVASLVITFSSAINVLSAATPHALAAWVPLVNLLLFLATCVMIGFGDALETRRRKMRVAV